ncbi:MAG TPA: glycosyl hydrolase family 28-related protein [Stellaceae bacterium]|nr:glycosyl hydrolase family 28-related protein [Stellaceae bacterium]
MKSFSRTAAVGIAVGVAYLVPTKPTVAQSPGNFSTLSTTGTATLGGDALMCSGRPWIDVRCNGAVGDDTHDDTSAIQTTINNAITNNWPLHIPVGTYKVTTGLIVDYASQAGHGFRLISNGAIIDGRAISAGPVVQVQCSGGSPSSPTGCFYFKEEGSLFVNADTPGYAFIVGRADFSDAHNSIKIDHLIVNNSNASSTAGACQFNYLLDSDIYAVCDGAGGGAGMAFEQAQFSRVSGAATASGTGGRGVVLENGYNFSNTFSGLDLEVSPTCLSITFNHNGLNTFVSPYFDCVTAVSATSSIGNTLINPNYGGNVVNYGPNSVGISVQGTGSRPEWIFPAAATYTAAPIDDGIAVSSYNAPGTSMSVTLPAVASVNPGWSMAVATDNGKGMMITTPTGSIVLGGRFVTSVTLGAGNYEYLRVQSDGNNWRVVSSTRNTRLNMGFEPPPWPSNWLYPTTSGYAATLGDNGNILSSYNTPSGLTVTLPTTTNLPTGWSIGFATDNGKALSVQVSATSGGHIVWPGGGASATGMSLANTSQGAYEFAVLQYDGSGSFRVTEATPATAQANGTIGTAGISHWSFPAASNYVATVTDNGNVVSSYNSPASYMAVTLPSTTAVPMGWTLALATDNGKAMSVQVNGTSGGHILYPGSGAAVTNLSLAPGNYELLVMRFDGGNFRITEATPATAGLIGMSGSTPDINRWNFPAAGTYAAVQSDNGNALSSYNTSAGLTVTLPSTTAIAPGWTMGFATDAGQPLTVQVNDVSGGSILEPARGGNSASSIALAAGQNYEFLQVRFDGSNFRVVNATPQTINALGGLITPGTPISGGAACNVGQLQADINYFYFCAAPNTWKRAALSSF